MDPEGEQKVLREAVLQPDVVSPPPGDGVDETEEDIRESPQQESEGNREQSLGLF